MWNPFRSPKLAPVISQEKTIPAKGSETPEYRAALDKAQLRSLLARTQINMIQENLASRALSQMRG